MSVFITDVWPRHGLSFIRVESKAALTEYPYEDASQRASQLAQARALAATEAALESTEIVDNSMLTHEPMPAAETVASVASGRASD